MNGTFKCDCPHVMRLNEDQHTCVGKWCSKPGGGSLGCILHLAACVRGGVFLYFSNSGRKSLSHFNFAHTFPTFHS